MKIAKLISIFLVLSLIFSGYILAQEKEEDRKMYEKAKKLIYEKDWGSAIATLREFLQTYKKSAYRDDSFYWMGYSLYKHSATLDNLDKQIEIQEGALEIINSLIEAELYLLNITDSNGNYITRFVFRKEFKTQHHEM